MPVIHQTARWWKPLRAFSIWGVTTHISDPNKITACTTAIYNLPSFLLSAPYLPNIFTISPHFPCARHIFCFTSGHSSLVDDIRRPNFFNEGTTASGIPCANKTLPIHSSVSATTNLCRFLSDLFQHISEFGCARLIASCGTNMSYWGHHGWG